VRRRPILVVGVLLAVSTVTALPVQAFPTASALEPRSLTRAQTIRVQLDARFRGVPDGELASTEATSTGFTVSAGAAPAVGTRTAAPTYPDSIAVIGHSFATGEGVTGPRAFRVRNSWITGDTSAVQSLYSRILARNPAIRGNKFNLARGGADVAEMLLQARKAITMKPAPELVVVQGIDNDITCDKIGHRPFRVAFTRVLDVLATGLPDARIFVVSQFGSVPTYIKALTLKQRINQRTRISPSSGPCAFLDARGAPIPKGVAYLEAVIHRYEAAVATACKAVANCRYDGGAFGRVVERPEYISWDVIHLSVEGQAKSAAVAWAALQTVGIIPSSG
jgi:hypothetical protein